MYTLGIESSCDETSVSVVSEGRKILSNIVYSSLKEHKKYGGIVPEIAFRAQLETIAKVANCAIEESGVSLKDIDLISVTNTPGLLGSLLIGITFAKSVSMSLGRPLLGVNHVHSHIYANFLNGENIKLPFIALVVSGGHTSLFYVKDFDKIEILGETQDDACGEAFDKVAKILGLGYPGGPIIEKIAQKGNPKNIKFRCSGTKKPLNFSFSGIKTAVLYYYQKHKDQELDIAASFQETVIDSLISKAFLACKVKKIKTLVIGGGVAANNRLRNKFFESAKAQGVKCFFPPKLLCMDNAAMVAGFGYRLYKKGHKSGLYLNAELN
ncbi:MAG: tRNA (adenosine(37)-N6)-threonylcarbamoyltransferase complex transferase subunit TsaD [Candidatus Omnitrophica bacterium]|nr:tRNA (adenosine(37)-N6)-threonylcarbamoyltransferase complex transferase subunit TsaD [Candidatus Omnitrophota bacterium]